MAVLAINGATENFSLAILKDDNSFFEQFYPGPTIKAENLIQLIADLLNEAKIEFKDINIIGTTIGPGAFTGLRLALVTAKTIALEKQIPLFTVSTLEAIAYQESEKNEDNKKIRIVLPACRGDVSTALFTADLKRLEPDHPVKATDIVAEPDTLLLSNIIPDAKTIAKLAKISGIRFDKNEIIKLVPLYSHEARVNKTSRIELQHLKIGNNYNA